MRGTTNRTRLNISRNETDLGRLVSAVNRLPFAFVGVSVARTNSYAPPDAVNWYGVTFEKVIDYDEMVNSSGASMTIRDGCDGVYQFTVISAGTGELALFRNTVALFTVNVTTRYAVSVPIELEIGTTLEWKFRGTSLSAGCQVSAQRLGLFP
jgi:hypothetical protein